MHFSVFLLESTAPTNTTNHEHYQGLPATKPRQARYKRDQSSVCFFGPCLLSHWPKGSNWKNGELWSFSSMAI